jgi:hypothetical protein
MNEVPREESRVDSDGIAYTRESFIAQYGGTAEWDLSLDAGTVQESQKATGGEEEEQEKLGSMGPPVGVDVPAPLQPGFSASSHVFLDVRDIPPSTEHLPVQRHLTPSAAIPSSSNPARPRRPQFRVGWCSNSSTMSRRKPAPTSEKCAVAPARRPHHPHPCTAALTRAGPRWRGSGWVPTQSKALISWRGWRTSNGRR